MKKQSIKGIALIIVILLFVPFVGFAQDSDDSNTVLAVTLRAAYPDGGTAAEFDSLYALLDENVVSKNKFIKSVMRVGHLYGSHSGDFIIITEYDGSGLGIIEEADEEDLKLFKKWKPDEEDRAEFTKKLNKYFTNYHSDEIYLLWSKVSK